MDTYCSIKQNYLQILLPREIDHHIAMQVKEEADSIIERRQISNLTFDFRNTVFMDSSGIGMLMGRYKLVHYMGGMVKAVHVNERIEKMLTIAGVLKFIEIQPDCTKNKTADKRED